MKLVTVKKEIRYSHERNGFYEIDNCVVSRIVNEVGKSIIEEINEGRDLDFISTKYCNGDINKRDLFIFLSDLRKMEYIDFEDDYFADLAIDEIVKIAGEKEYLKISEYILNNEDSIMYSPITKKEFFNIIALRTRSFYNKENFLFEERDNSIANIIGVKGFDKINSPVVISFILCSDKTMDSLVSFYNHVENFFTENNKRKVKIIFDTNEINPSMEEFMSKAGFVFEAELKCEDGDKDSIIYSKLI